ncbi:hypothetical protein Pyn_09245 [Prunus yedoensis var. nudiflora]|uniref:Serpin domain-containing protein n=1 Tax=Prunus yedoensis var. nudiflora TaxID=2094558 RepID=A0A314XTY3_PRUYE|nr:hypothetical protein Pyn_09245 [Prunus yedoensis var. nudiflora]
MTSHNRQFIKAFDGFKVLKLPYKRGKDEQRRFCMCLFLPDEKDGLPALVERVCSEPGFLDRHIPHYDVELGLELPSSVEEMVESPLGEGPFDSKMSQVAVIEVNEEGTEAAAVSVWDNMGMCLGEYEPPVDFVADHPFLFLIREEMTGAVLFIGQLLNPLLD